MIGARLKTDGADAAKIKGLNRNLGPFDQLLSDLQVAEVAKTFGFGGHRNSWRVPLRQ